jgi:diguanylate cyclase (GGDEF)-like protein
MGAYLHSSVSDQELFEIVAGTLRRLWPSVSGGLYIFGSSKREVGLVASWGDASGSLRRKMSAEDCWALRRGRSHQSGELINAPRCEHHDSAIQLSCQCIPLLGHGEVLGVLHLYADSAEKIGALNSGSRTGLLLAMTNQVALSLANLRLREALREQSLMDPLTGLYNRRVVDDWFEREIGDAVRDHRPLSVLVIDIDNFKRYNDTYGHECGDLALCEVAAVLRQRIRGGDLACRVGGEEFVLLLPDTTGADAVTLADALRELVASVVPTRNGKMLGRITVSIGAASLGVHGSCKEQLLRAADQALYRAKDQGRNRTVFATGLGESGVHGRTRTEANA